MFTFEQIKAVHSKVKSGADFPRYIQDIIALGVKKYDTFVSDGHSHFFGADDFSTTSPAKYDMKSVAESSNGPKLIERLKFHQNGGTDYLTFCEEAASFGVEKWTVDTVKMTCTYYDKAGNTMLTEDIPQG